MQAASFFRSREEARNENFQLIRERCGAQSSSFCGFREQAFWEANEGVAMAGGHAPDLGDRSGRPISDGSRGACFAGSLSERSSGFHFRRNRRPIRDRNRLR